MDREICETELTKLTKFAIKRYGNKYTKRLTHNDFGELFSYAMLYASRWDKSKGIRFSYFVVGNLRKWIMNRTKKYQRLDKILQGGNFDNFVAPAPKENNKKIADYIDMAGLDYKEKIVIKALEENSNGADLAREYNLTRARINQIKQSAIAKLERVMPRD